MVGAALRLLAGNLQWAALAGLLVTAAWTVYRHGVEGERERWEAERASVEQELRGRAQKLENEARRTAARLIEAQRERESLADDLRRTARLADGANRRCLDAGGLRRVQEALRALRPAPAAGGAD